VTGRVALVSTGEYAHLDEDLPPIVTALSARRIDVVVADWHDAGFAWDGVDLAVIRSTWDYTWQLDDYLAWVDRADRATRLVNPGPVVRWNTDKRYLLDLAALGVPTVPTRIIDPGDDPAVGDDLAGDGEIVVKPVISAGARDTERYGPDQLGDAHAHVVRLQGRGRSVLVQPYLPDIDEHGETGLVFLGDAFSHAFRKGPILVPGTEFVDGLYREEDISPRTASAAELEVAAAALDAVASAVPGMSRRDLLYARVDVAPYHGGPVVLELELVEPSFFCTTDPGAAERAADAIAAALAP
jgi:glutathione synthase/RimK-type ligase-like ATP-grasp enzyme